MSEDKASWRWREGVPDSGSYECDCGAGRHWSTQQAGADLTSFLPQLGRMARSVSRPSPPASPAPAARAPTGGRTCCASRSSRVWPATRSSPRPGPTWPPPWAASTTRASTSPDPHRRTRRGARRRLGRRRRHHHRRASHPGRSRGGCAAIPDGRTRHHGTGCGPCPPPRSRSGHRHHRTRPGGGEVGWFVGPSRRGHPSHVGPADRGPATPGGPASRRPGDGDGPARSPLLAERPPGVGAEGDHRLRPEWPIS